MRASAQSALAKLRPDPDFGRALRAPGGGEPRPYARVSPSHSFFSSEVGEGLAPSRISEAPSRIPALVPTGPESRKLLANTPKTNPAACWAAEDRYGSR
jgi:hypothetical protein